MVIPNKNKKENKNGIWLKLEYLDKLNEMAKDRFLNTTPEEVLKNALLSFNKTLEAFSNDLDKIAPIRNKKSRCFKPEFCIAYPFDGPRCREAIVRFAREGKKLYCTCAKNHSFEINFELRKITFIESISTEGNLEE
ncbi:MAG: hypothetical protein RBG13Loki_0960 [Promethearchaeota archaeon CR_4]|nr:MAG: hypothetical protein RBG13Loki_0960 [Candidatus Lokiarchaeota archaeon CR_4]